jgi:hypothetical protein
MNHSEQLQPSTYHGSGYANASNATEMHDPQLPPSDHATSETSDLSARIDEAHQEVLANQQQFDRALGQKAVATAAEVAHGQIIEQSEPTQEAQEAKLKEELEQARSDISAASPGERKAFGKRLFDDGLPGWLIASVGEDTPSKFAQKLTEKGEDGQYAVANSTLLNVLEWHNMNLEQKRLAAETELIGPMRERFIYRMQTAVDRQWIKPDMFTEEEAQLVRELPVYIDDGIGPDDNFRQRTAGSAEAYADPGKYLALRTTERNMDTTEHTFTHEMVHHMSGDRHQDSTQGSLLRYGLEKLLPRRVSESFGFRTVDLTQKDSRGLSLLNEATTDHFANALISGDIDTVRPFGLRSSYRTGQRLLKTLCTKGLKKINPAVFVRAMLAQESDDIYDDTPQPDVEALQTELAHSFPNVNVIDDVAQMNTYAMTGTISNKEILQTAGKIKRSNRPGYTKEPLPLAS